MVSKRTRSTIRSVRTCALINARRIDFFESSLAIEASKFFFQNILNAFLKLYSFNR